MEGGRWADEIVCAWGGSSQFVLERGCKVELLLGASEGIRIERVGIIQAPAVLALCNGTRGMDLKPGRGPDRISLLVGCSGNEPPSVMVRPQASSMAALLPHEEINRFGTDMAFGTSFTCRIIVGFLVSYQGSGKRPSHAASRESSASDEGSEMAGADTFISMRHALSSFVVQSITCSRPSLSV